MKRFTEVQIEEATKEITEYFREYGVEITTNFSFSDFVKFTGYSEDQCWVALVNMESDDMDKIANGDYSSFDLNDKAQFNDSYYDMIEDFFPEIY